MHRIIINIFCALLLTIFFACKRDAAGGNKKVFNMNLDQGLTSLDPAFSRNQNAMWMINQIFNGLVQIDSVLNTKPCIAKSWTISEDGLTYTFNLRNDVYFHDHPLFSNGKGRKVVASDFVYSFFRIIDPKVASSGGWIFSDKVTDLNNFKAINDTTFLIQLTKPSPAFMKILATQYCSVVPKEIVEHYGKDFRSNPVGTGPFKFKYWKEDEILVLLKNESYWEKENNISLPYLDAVKVSFISDKQSAFMNFIKKELDFFDKVDGSYRDDILTKSGKMTNKYKNEFTLLKAPYLCTEYVGILVDTSLSIAKNSPLKYKKVRQAINYAIDKPKLIKYLRNGVGIPATSGFVPEGMPGFDSTAVKGYHYNPEKAYAILSDQDRGTYRITPNTPTKATSWTITPLISRKIAVSDVNFMLPIPASELTRLLP
ncbi:MAG: ABC transporter substrate-binding protein [Pedobacter sp.]|nr:MAG: ABC transporter substrate-binding protein [Pedobacter sp.]